MEPDFRVTLLPNGTVRLVCWHPGLCTGGALQTLIHARGRAGIGIADLERSGEDDAGRELTAVFLAGDTPAARAALTGWAADAGYARLWLPDAVVELEPVPAGPRQTRCTACRVRLVDAAPSLWDYVRDAGHFPLACPLCGGDLPQWTPTRQLDVRVSGRERPARPTRCGETR
jgi:hypothetical protein